MKKLMQGLWEQKVPQYLGTYFAVGFGLLQFFEFITKRYNLSEFLVDKYLLVWLALMPAFVVLIYFDGKLNQSPRAGVLRWPKFFVLGNVVVAFALAVLLFNGGRAEQSALIELTNEEGKKVKAFVPSLNRVKTVACFQFDNLKKDKNLDWWGVAFSHLLQLNLNQRPEFYTSSVYTLNRYYDALGLTFFTLPSVGMQREIAQKSRSDYFTRISYAIEKNKFVFKGNLYDASDGKPIVELKVTNDDPYAAIDEIKQQILRNIPGGLADIEKQVSLPASSLITSNIESLNFLTQSRIVFAKNPSGLDEVLRLAKKSVELDPSCALCHYYVGDPLYGLGKRDEAIKHIKSAIKYGASLPKRMQFTPKETLYRMTNKMDTYIKLQEMRRKMFPYEFSSYQVLLPIYKASYGVDSAKVLLQNAIDNGNLEKGLLALYDLQLENEEYAEAKKTLDRFVSEFPNRDEDRIKYATIYEKQGKLKAAKKILLEEEVLNPLNTRIQTRLAYLDFKNLDIIQANQRVSEGIEQATSLTDSLQFMWIKSYFLRQTGQVDRAIKAYAMYEKYAVKLSPVNRVLGSTFVVKSDLYQSTGESEKQEELFAYVTKYSPEQELTYRCQLNTNALERDYNRQMDIEEFATCRKVFQSFGEGYGEYGDVIIEYQSGNYAACMKILDGDNGRVQKLFNSKFFIAHIYALAGEAEKAKEIVQKVIDQKTDEPLYYYRMAVLLEKENKKASQKFLDIALQYWSTADEDYIPLQRAKELTSRLTL